MTSSMAIDLVREALRTSLILGGPILAAVFLVSLTASALLAATQMQESSLSFVPKLIAVGVVVAIGLPWLVDFLTGYAGDLVMTIPARL